MPRPLAMLCLIAAMTMGGANVPFGKAIVAEVPIEAFMLARFAAATALLAALSPLEAGPRLHALPVRSWLGVAVLALFGSVLFTAFLLAGLQRTSAVDAGIITATLPAVVVMAGIVLGDRPRVGEVAMVGLAVAGVALIQVTAAQSGPTSLMGNLLIGLAVLCEASFVIVSRSMGRLVGPLRLSLGVAGLSLVFCVPLLATGQAYVDPTSIAAGTWLLIGWYSLTASVLATVLWYRGVPHVPAWAAGLATAALPVSALAVSVLWLGEKVDGMQLAGAGLVVMAILTGTLTQRHRRLPPAPPPTPPPPAAQGGG